MWRVIVHFIVAVIWMIGWALILPVIYKLFGDALAEPIVIVASLFAIIAAVPLHEFIQRRV